jgi:hypothetical protein
LLLSLNSAIVPDEVAFDLSAQALTEYVPATVNVYEGEVMVRVAPFVKAAVEAEARSVIVPPPLVAFAT